MFLPLPFLRHCSGCEVLWDNPAPGALHSEVPSAQGRRSCASRAAAGLRVTRWPWERTLLPGATVPLQKGEHAPAERTLPQVPVCRRTGRSWRRSAFPPVQEWKGERATRCRRIAKQLSGLTCPQRAHCVPYLHERSWLPAIPGTLEVRDRQRGTRAACPRPLPCWRPAGSGQS